MKLLLVLSIFLYSSYVEAQNLKCSANGTDVYYINGVLTNKNKNISDTAAISSLFDIRQSLLDSGIKRQDGTPAVKFIGIHNPSFGLVNDVAELFSQAYYAKTGKDDGKAIFNLIQNMPDNVGTIVSPLDPSGFSSVVGGFFGYTNTINFASLKYLADESYQTALVRTLASTDKLLKEKDAVIDGIITNYTNSKKANHKVLFVAHSQGNAALNAGIKKIELTQPADVDYIKKFVGFYHVASPVPPLTQYNSRNLRSEQDKVIAAAQIFSNSLPLEFQTTTAPITHRMTVPSTSDLTGHYFYDSYISSSVSAVPISNLSSAPVKMSDNFVTTLSNLATDLEDNCNIPVIKLTSTEAAADLAGVIQISGYADINRFIKINAKDIAVNESDSIALQNGYDHSSTLFSWKVIQNYPSYAGKDKHGAIIVDEQDVVDSINLQVPYRDITYDVIVTAENLYGKTTSQTFRFVVSANKVPSISISDIECSVDSSGYSDGEEDFTINIKDDQYLVDGTSSSSYSIERVINVTAFDGTNTTSKSFTNTCPVVGPTYTCNVVNTCVPNVESSGSGAYSTSVLCYNEKNVLSKRYDWPAMSVVSETSYPDPNDNTKRVFITVGGTCTE